MVPCESQRCCLRTDVVTYPATMMLANIAGGQVSASSCLFQIVGSALRISVPAFVVSGKRPVEEEYRTTRVYSTCQRLERPQSPFNGNVKHKLTVLYFCSPLRIVPFYPIVPWCDLRVKISRPARPHTARTDTLTRCTRYNIKNERGRWEYIKIISCENRRIRKSPM